MRNGKYWRSQILGVVLDTKLHFQSHISQILIKLTSSVGLHRKLYLIGNRELLLATYNGLIISYAIDICVWES